MHGKRVILAQVRRVRRRASLAAAIPALLAALTIVLAAWWLAARIAPLHASAVAMAAGLAAAAFVLSEAWRARPSVALIGQRWGVDDALATYWPLRDRNNEGMSLWLESALAARLAARPPLPRAPRGRRRPLRRLLALAPLLLALLLLRFLLPVGLGDGRRLGPQSPSGGDAGASGSGAGGEPTGGEPRQEAREPATEEPAARDRITDGERGGEVPSRAIDLPVREEFVVPSFVGEGPSRTAKAPEAEQEASVAPRAAAAAGAAGAQPLASPQEFERHAERAGAARHVPPAERPIVQRYFRALAERR